MTLAYSLILVAYIGTGGVGRAFIEQLRALNVRRSQQFYSSLQLSIVLLARRSKILYSEDFRTLSLDNWEADLNASHSKLLSLTELEEYLAKVPGKAIWVDNTSDQKVAEAYPAFLRRGISIVTPNKKAFSGSYELWQDIFATASKLGSGKIFHESSVGAGLPVISTLKELVETGDEIHKIEGVFSGTMSFLFNSFAPVDGKGGKFSDEVKKAKRLGYTVSRVRNAASVLSLRSYRNQTREMI